MTTYVDMQTRIADECLTGPTITTAQIKLEIQSAITHYARQRFEFNEGETTAGTTTAGQLTANNLPPTDFFEVDSLEVTYGGNPYPVRARTWDWFIAIGGRSTQIGRGPPSRFVYRKSLFYLWPVPDATYTLTLAYLKALAALSQDTDTNAWMVQGEELIRNRARQAVLINYAKDDAAKQEQALMLQLGLPFYSHAERVAYQSLVATGVDAISTGYITPTSF